MHVPLMSGTHPFLLVTLVGLPFMIWKASWTTWILVEELPTSFQVSVERVTQTLVLKDQQFQLGQHRYQALLHHRSLCYRRHRLVAEAIPPLTVRHQWLHHPVHHPLIIQPQPAQHCRRTRLLPFP
jgi:hypothetical protein